MLFLLYNLFLGLYEKSPIFLLIILMIEPKFFNDVMNLENKKKYFNKKKL